MDVGCSGGEYLIRIDHIPDRAFGLVWPNSRTQRDGGGKNGWGPGGSTTSI